MSTKVQDPMGANIYDFKGLKVSLASPDQILSWSYGEVTKPETINYRTLKPEKDGLFSENIFGPTKDWECYCGKYKRIRYRGIVCDKCGVEVAQSKVRRERMGHINLAVPVAHVWFFKGAPSKLSLILDLSPKSLENVVYFASHLVLEVNEDKRSDAVASLKKTMEERQKALIADHEVTIKDEQADHDEKIKTQKDKIKDKDQLGLAIAEIDLTTKQKIAKLESDFSLEKSRLIEIYRTLSDLVKGVKVTSELTEEEFLKLEQYNAADFIRVGMGAEAILEILKNIDLEKLAASLRKELVDATGPRKVKATKRLRIIDGMRRSKIRPEWMILSVLPVIPPDLRPMVQLSGGRFATSDLNDLYRRVINRNNRLKHLMDLGAPEIINRNEKRMLQEAVDALIDSTQRGTTSRGAQTELKSLSDMLRGKQGRFRQNLLGKRVDYSGRSVIVVGPKLSLSECGLPKEMALEMFKPFVLRELIFRGIAPNVKAAKYVLEKRTPEVFDILEEITKNHPVLLNRAPTLHKLGIQAFYPVLIEGSAIQVHPLVCAGYGADFDGDQMAVHVPLSSQSKAEAIELMTTENNLLKPADGMPVAFPNKEMILGIFYYTSIDDKLTPLDTIFADVDEAITAYQEKKVELRQKIKMRHNKAIVETTLGRILVNEIIPDKLGFVNETITLSKLKSLLNQAMDSLEKQEFVKLLDKLKEIGFDGSMISGISVGMFDLVISDQKEPLIGTAEKQVAEIEENYRAGLITGEEMRRLQIEIWYDTTNQIADLTWDAYPKENSVKMILESGAGKSSKDNVKQVSGMRGLMVDPTGRVISLPTKTNFREGLSVFEYVTGTRGSRKSLADIALRTADAGYLTRRLVDVAHDVIIREQDCGATEGVEIVRNSEKSGQFLRRILGRVAASDIKAGKKVIVAKDSEITEANLSEIEKEKIDSITVRSPLMCRAKRGLCRLCYGRDFSTRKLVEIGVPVGVIGAQSIGEPGTQLTLRSKHTGGTVAQDVTQGLPRVEELFEARAPKVLSPVAEIAGKVEVIESEDGVKVRIRSHGVKPVDEREYIIPAASTLRVNDGDLVAAGTQLASGYLDIKDILNARGLAGAQKYLIEELQAVYESQGVGINDKHYEVIVRKMSDKVRIETSGDTVFLPGEFVEKVRFEEENARVIAAGGEPATAQVTILGVSRAALHTSSWLSAASFERTTEILSEAAINGDEDSLVGLKENVIIGRLIPTSAERAMAKT